MPFMSGGEPQAIVPFPLENLRIGIPRGLMFENVDAVVGAAFEAQVKALEQKGARVVDVAIDDLIMAVRQATSPGPIAAIEAAAIHADWLDSRAADYDKQVLSRMWQAAP